MRPRQHCTTHKRHTRNRRNHHGRNHTQAHALTTLAIRFQPEVGDEAVFEDEDADEGDEPEDCEEGVEG